MGSSRRPCHVTEEYLLVNSPHARVVLILITRVAPVMHAPLSTCGQICLSVLPAILGLRMGCRKLLNREYLLYQAMFITFKTRVH